MLYHYVFRTYKGLPLLEYKELRDFLKQLFLIIAIEKGFQIIECEVLSDHVHVLIDQGYVLSASMVMKYLKGVSARRLFQKYETNRLEHRKLWSRSFYVRKICDPEEEKRVIAYIKGQRDKEGTDKRWK